MPRIDFDAYIDDNAEPDSSKRDWRLARGRSGPLGRQARVLHRADLIEHAHKLPVEAQGQTFAPTFQPAEHERYWLLNYLEGFYNAQIITNVLGKVKGGKEANVYCCAAHPSTGLDLIAAKLYRPQMFRNLRNDARYRQGRVVTDQDGKASVRRRETLAVRKNTRFGQELRHISWLEAEYQTLQLLYAAGVDVPRPLARGENVILMEYVGALNAPAPALNQVTLEPLEARRMFDRLVDQLSTMLACHRVHADLSAYNILYWQGHFKLIDFPQAVDPRRNPDAADLFIRDVERLCQYFARYGMVTDAPALATQLWSLYRRANALDSSAVVPLLGQPLASGEP
jgi:RIO kinase 1